MLFYEFLSAAHWQKMNTSPVCFGSKNNKFGKFRAPYGGKLVYLRLTAKQTNHVQQTRLYNIID